METEAGQRLADTGLGHLRLLQAAGGEDDVVTGLGEDLGDTARHGARAGHTHRADLAAGGRLRGRLGGQRVVDHLRGVRSGVRVEAAAGLAAGQARLAELLQDGRRSVQPVVRLRVHGVQDGTGGVDADQVEQRERPHRQTAAELHRGVDVLTGRVPRLVHRRRLVEVAEQQAVGHESGPVADRDRLLAELLGERGDGLNGRRRGEHAGDHLDQLHRRRRVEEVQAEHALRVLGIGGEPGHGEGVGAGGDDRLRPDDAVQRPHDLELGLVRLGHHLDDEVGLRRGLKVTEGAEAGEGVAALLLGDPLALHGAGGGGLEREDGPAGRGVADVDADDLTAGAGEDLGDAGAHGAEADDGNGVERGVHHGTPGMSDD
ncbi:hypothetical protein QFZ68_005935 [Streptomyces sp. V1I6]|nr:hypothetical protein [Streptomyces sp. V1I6]